MRGPINELMVLALLAFCRPRIDSSVLPLNMLKMSTAGVIFTRLAIVNVLSTRKSTVWKFGRRLEPHWSSNSSTWPPPFARVGEYTVAMNG